MSLEASDLLQLLFEDAEEDQQSNRSGHVELNTCYAARHFPFERSPLHWAPIVDTQALTQGADVKKVYKLGLSLEESHRAEWLPGDSIGIMPCNDEITVNEILLRLGVDADADRKCRVSLSKQSKKKEIPAHLPRGVSTLREIFRRCVDLRTPPKKLFLKAMLKFTSNSTELLELKSVSAAKNPKSKYETLISGPGATLLGLLKTFPSCRPPVTLVLEHLPALLPRPYSISSSIHIVNRLEITFNVYEKDDGSLGVCSGWLEKRIQEFNSTDKEIAVLVPFYYRVPTEFRIPLESTDPMILVGTGTGIAPFRSYLASKSICVEKNQPIGDTWLFYGCRYKDKDFLYKHEISKFSQTGVLNSLSTSFSREDSNNKVHVQDRMLANGEKLVKWILLDGAVVYVCGPRRTLITEVKTYLVTVFVTFGEITEAEAHNYIHDMERNKKFILDSWN